jgi:hypothetical protein
MGTIWTYPHEPIIRFLNIGFVRWSGEWTLASQARRPHEPGEKPPHTWCIRLACTRGQFAAMKTEVGGVS